MDTRRILLGALSTILRLPVMRGRISISELAYKHFSLGNPIVQMNVNGIPVTLDLSQKELRYIYFGAYERNEVDFLQRWLRCGDVVIDVGANVGYLSAVMAGIVEPEGKVYAFEPNPSMIVELK